MLHFTLGPRRELDPTVDEMGRTWNGYDRQASPQDLYDVNRSCWVLGQRADRESYALFSYDREVVLAVEIEEIVSTPTRRALKGRPLAPGHPVYDQYVGKAAPIQGQRNPVGYFTSSFDERFCGCGCGKVVGRGDFLPGHDQRAIHERISKVGTVKEFIDWFDDIYLEPAIT